MVECDSSTVKVCRACGIAKSHNEFHPAPSGKPRGRCKECINAERRKGLRKKAVFTELGKVCTLCGVDKELSEYRLRSSLNSTSSNPYRSRCNACQHKLHGEWNEKNKGNVVCHTSAWKGKYPLSIRAYAAARKARKIGSGGSYSIKDIEKLFVLQRGLCASSWCGEKLRDNYHVDHIVPFALGGNNGALNIQLLCPTCNLRKGARDPVEFMQSMGLLI